MNNPDVQPTGGSLTSVVDESRVAAFRLRIFDAAAELKPNSRPIAGPEELRDRLIATARDLSSIQHDLMLLLHCTQLEEHGVVEDVEKLAVAVREGRYEAGVDPDVFVSRLRDRLAASR